MEIGGQVGIVETADGYSLTGQACTEVAVFEHHICYGRRGCLIGSYGVNVGREEEIGCVDVLGKALDLLEQCAADRKGVGIPNYNTARPHRALRLRPPRPTSMVPELAYGGIRRRPILGGLLVNKYEAAP
jgi:hypothetical protein